MSVFNETRPRVNRSSQAKSPPVITDPSLSPNDFARAESISLGLLYKLWKAGDGPAYFYIGRSRRISAAARQAWRTKREAEAAQQSSDAA
jgi:hypothetical protein